MRATVFTEMMFMSRFTPITSRFPLASENTLLGSISVPGWIGSTLARMISLVMFISLGFLSSDLPNPKNPLLYPVCELSPADGNLLVAPGSGSSVQSPYIGIWISKKELAQLPTQGPAWNALKKAADYDPGKPDIKDQNEKTDVYVLAKALVYARTGDQKYRAEVMNSLALAVGTEKGGRTLALGRNLAAYVISADLINLPKDPPLDRVFRSWLRSVLAEKLEDGRNLRSTQEERPNNWGTHAGASRVAVALYLGDNAELDRAAAVFKGYLGDQTTYHGFRFNPDLSWQCDPTNPVPINPKGCMKNGHSIDGALPEELRRGGSYQWPPVETGYAWEGLQGAVVTAEILTRAGYPAWEWQDRALLRAVEFLYGIDWKPQKDDQWQIWLINRAYGTNFPTVSPTSPGKNMGWTDWTQDRPVQPDDSASSRVLRCR